MLWALSDPFQRSQSRQSRRQPGWCRYMCRSHHGLGYKFSGHTPSLGEMFLAGTCSDLWGVWQLTRSSWLFSCFHLLHSLLNRNHNVDRIPQLCTLPCLSWDRDLTMCRQWDIISPCGNHRLPVISMSCRLGFWPVTSEDVSAWNLLWLVAAWCKEHAFLGSWFHVSMCGLSSFEDSTKLPKYLESYSQGGYLATVFLIYLLIFLYLV